MTTGEKICAGRTELGLSQEALGEKLGVTRQAVSKWENDLAIPGTENFIALSQIFGVPASELMKSGGEIFMEPQNEKKSFRLKRKRWVQPRFGLLLVVIAIFAFSQNRNRELKNQAEGWLSSVEFDMIQDENKLNYEKFAMTLLPRGTTEDLEIEFTLKPLGEEGKTIVGQKGEGGYYSTCFDLENLAGQPFEVSVHLRKGAQEYTRSIVTISEWGDGQSFTQTPSI